MFLRIADVAVMGEEQIFRMQVGEALHRGFQGLGIKLHW